MTKEKKYNLLALGASVLLPIIIIFAFKFALFETWGYETISDIVNPLFYASIGLIPTLLILLWRGGIFISWFRHIAWWNILIALFIVSSNENESFLSPIENDSSVIIACMALLFVITLIYALVMNRKTKGNS